MADTNSISENKHFSNPSRAYTELFQLLPQMPRGPKPDNSYGFTCESDLLRAAAQHAENSVDALSSCLQSLGRLMFIAGNSKETSAADLAEMGWLVQEMSNMLEACEGLRSNTEYELAKRGELI